MTKPSIKTRLQNLVLRSIGLGSFAHTFSTGADIVDTTPNARLAQPYRQSAWVRAAINLISGEISSRPLKFYDGEKAFEDTKFLDWWTSPALGIDSIGRTQRIPLADVLEQLTAWAKLKGEFFLLLDDAWLLATAPRNPAALTPFIIADPDRVRLILNNGTLTGYEYIDPAGRRFAFVPDQVLHWHNFNPYDPYRGIGDLQAATVAAEAAHATGIYIRDLMRNNNDQGYIVVGKSGVATDEQRDQVTAALIAKRAALARGQAKDLFLTGDITVDRPKEQAAGADLHAGKALSHQEVFIAFGVPPSMAEVKASYSIGSASDRYQLITGTCTALAHRIAGTFAKIATLQTGRTLTAECDWDDHPVMLEARAARVDTALKLWGAGMPMKEINGYLDLGMSPFDGWDIGYLPFSVSPATLGDSTPAQPNPANPSDPALAEPADNEDPSTLALKITSLLRQRTASKPACTRNGTSTPHPIDTLFACTCGHDNGATTKARDPKELSQWRTHMSQRLETVKNYSSAFGRILMAARRETLAKIESTAGKSTITRAAAADLLFDLGTFTAAFRGMIDKQTAATLQKAGQQLFTEVSKDDPFAYPPPAVIQFLQARQNKLTNVPQQIHDSIKIALEDGFNNGETMAQLASRVRSAFNGIDRERAHRIAMTETAACYGAARDEAMRQAGIQYKRWLTSGNDNVRSSHAAANGQTVHADSPFHVGGEDLAYPGDSRGSAENVINCHCVSIATAEKSPS